MSDKRESVALMNYALELLKHGCWKLTYHCFVCVHVVNIIVDSSIVLVIIYFCQLVVTVVW